MLADRKHDRVGSNILDDILVIFRAEFAILVKNGQALDGSQACHIAVLVKYHSRSAAVMEPNTFFFAFDDLDLVSGHFVPLFETDDVDLFVAAEP